MSKKVVFFAFEGEMMCFSHLLFNAVDMHKKGIETKIVIEGAATKLVEPMIEKENPHFKEAMDLGLIDSICKACSNQLGVLEYNESTGIPMNGDLLGHPPMEPYIKNEYELVIM